MRKFEFFSFLLQPLFLSFAFSRILLYPLNERRLFIVSLRLFPTLALNLLVEDDIETGEQQIEVDDILNTAETFPVRTVADVYQLSTLSFLLLFPFFIF